MEAYNPKSEYDAFGPWIYELNKNQLPPLFSSHYREATSPLLLIEIPRNIERRNAKQGMDLYDYVIGMYDEYVYLLERKEKSVIESKIAYDEITMVEDFRDLLYGKLTIFTTSRKIEIFYNTVSGDIIAKLLMMIRGKYAKKSYHTVSNNFCPEPGTEILYNNLLFSMKSKGDLFDASAMQPSIVVKSIHQNILAKLVNAIFKKQLLPSLHLLNSRELLIISRGKPFKHLDAVYSYALDYMPIEKIRGIELISDDSFLNLQKLHIRMDHFTQTYYLGADNSSLLEYYKELQNAL